MLSENFASSQNILYGDLVGGWNIGQGFASNSASRQWSDTIVDESGNNIVDHFGNSIYGYNFAIDTAAKEAEVDYLWTPAQITTNLWLDAYDATTITESGGNVSKWDDKSGNNNHAIQETSSQQPVYATNAKLSNNYGLQFDYLNDSNMFCSNSSTLNFQYKMTGFIVYSETGDSANNHLYQRILGNANPSMGMQSGNSSSPNYGITSNNSGFRIALLGEFNVTDAVMISHGHSITDDEIRINKNGSSFITNSVGSETQVSQDGGGIRLGNQKIGTNRGHDGFIHELILIEDRLSIADVQIVEGYLAHKWGLEGNLDSGHPYKTTPPTV